MTGCVRIGWVVAAAVATALLSSCGGESLRGAFVFGHEVRTFQPCGSDSVFWVRAPTDVLDELRSRRDALTDEAYRAVYVELEGVRSRDPTQGFAEQYDGYVDVSRLRSITEEIPASCVGTDTSTTTVRGLNDLSLLLGRWEGELEYLDYQDDETRVTLPVWLTVQWSAGDTAIAFAYTYGEPDGRRVDGRESLLIGPDGRVWLDGWWESALLRMARARGSAEVALTREGVDNERPATIRRQILVRPGHLTMSKEVRYEGSEAFLTRNTYRLTTAGDRRPAG